MDRVLSHEEVSELLGAYALDAVEAEDVPAIARHVAECGRCAAELESYHEVAGMLGNAGGEAPPHLWARLADEIAHTEAPERGDDRVVELLGGRVARTPRTRSRRASGRRAGTPRVPAGLRWAAAAVAAAALVVIGVLGYQVDHLDQRVDQMDAAAQSVGVVQAAQAAMLDPSAHDVSLAASGGTAAVVMEIVILPSGSAYVINSKLRQLPATRTYQLWGQLGGRMVSLGLLGNHPVDVAVHVDPGAAFDFFAVTSEPAGGVVQPTTSPVAESHTVAA